MSLTEIAGTNTVSHWINGAYVPSTSGRAGDIYNPATGETIGRVAFASVDEVDQAVAAAKAASSRWRSTPLSRRAEVMFRLRDLIAQNRQRIAETLTRENGKTSADALGEVARGLENVE